ncbi:C2CD3 protein, partial [Cisticola juncidis]|nr:C2CD3 protein [Cisticola juncidis]
AQSVTVTFRRPSTATLRRSQGLLWFLREEKLEIQVWWACGKEGEGERPLDTDHLIGSAYVSLAALAETSRTTLSVSGVYPLFRCNAPDLAGAAMRVQVSLAAAPATPAAAPAVPAAPAAPTTLPCAPEGSSTEDEGSGETPGRSQQGSDQQHVATGSPGTTSGQPQEEDVTFLENTVAVHILVERAMHLSLKGSPLTEQEVAAPSSCVSFAVAGADAPVTTPVVENTDCPVWDFQQQARLSKELLLDPQQTLVFKVWHKAESERVIGFASVDLSPLLWGFQRVCGWYDIADLGAQCHGQLKVAVCSLQSLSSLREQRQARARSQPGSSAMKISFPACPSNSTNLSKQMLNSSLKEVSVPTRERRVGPHTPRHEEHARNVRRFHECLQQAEGSACRAPGMDTASHTARTDTAPHMARMDIARMDTAPCTAGLDTAPHMAGLDMALPASNTARLDTASRTALLSGLRKNLSELDEVQRYFTEKLTRSFPDFSTSTPSPEEWQRDHQGSMSREVNPKGCHPLEKSTQLVSQVSSLINDLQSVTANSREASDVHQDSSRSLAAVDVPSWREQGASPEGRAVFDRHMLHQLLGPLVPEDGDPEGYSQENQGAFAMQPHSEEEYEEDVIEPRTLNEITTGTDRTSPWSSGGSEAGQGAEHQHSREGSCFQGGDSSTLSSILQGDSQGVPSALSPPRSPQAGRTRPWGAAGDSQSCQGSAGTAGQEPPLPARQSLNRALSTEHTKESVELPADPRELLPSSGDTMGLTHQNTTEREEEEGAEAADEGHGGREGSGSDENCAHSVSAQAGSERNSESFPDDSSEDPVEGSENPINPKITLSDPVVVPNFFLPPQEMEASMRLLSTSSHPSMSPKVSVGSVPAGIPYRRGSRPRPGPELSEEEAQRIARIFSAQLSKKE